MRLYTLFIVVFPDIGELILPLTSGTVPPSLYLRPYFSTNLIYPASP